MKISSVLFVIICLVAGFLSCSKGGDDGGGNPGPGPGTLDCSAVPKSFSADVNPIVQTFCNQSGCHATGSSNGPGPLTNYAQVSAAKAQIRAAIASGRMPQNTTLSESQKNSFLCWIDSGAPNN